MPSTIIQQRAPSATRTAAASHGTKAKGQQPLDCSARGFLGNGNWNRAEKWCYSQLLTDHYLLTLHEFIIEIIGKPKLRAKTEDKSEKFIQDV